MWFLKGYNTTDISISAREKTDSRWNTLAKKHKIVQIMSGKQYWLNISSKSTKRFEPWKGITAQVEYSPVNQFQKLHPNIVRTFSSDWFYILISVPMTPACLAPPKVSPLLAVAQESLSFIPSYGYSPHSRMVVELANYDPHLCADVPAQHQPNPVPRNVPEAGAVSTKPVVPSSLAT